MKNITFIKGAGAVIFVLGSIFFAVPFVAHSDSVELVSEHGTYVGDVSDLIVQGGAGIVAHDWQIYGNSIAPLAINFDNNIQNFSSLSVPVQNVGVTYAQDSGRIAGSFDGLSEVHINDGVPGLYQAGEDITFGGWIKPENIQQRAYVASKRQLNSTFNQWGLSIFDGTINYGSGKKIVCTYGIANGNFHDVATIDNIVDGNWHHVVCRVRFGQGIDIFVDGVQVPTFVIRNQGWQPALNNEPFTIGSAGTQFYYKGDIDLVRIYDRALSSEQIGLFASNKDYILSHHELSTGERWSAQVVQSTSAIEVEAQQNQAPVLSAFSPSKQVQWLSATQQFTGYITCEDPEQTPVSYQWLLDGNPVSPTSSVELDYTQIGQGEHTLEAICTDQDGVSTSRIYSLELLQEGDFAVIMPSNVQTVADLYPAILNELSAWIVDSKEQLQTKFVTFSGDVVNIGYSTRQWNNLSSALGVLDNELPYAIAIGNHDYDANLITTNNGTRSSTYFQSYFPLSRFASNTWWGGQQYNENINTYQFLEQDGREFMFMHVEFCPSDTTLAWANDLVAQHPQKHVIITTHLYMNFDNTTVDANDPYNCEMFLDSSYISGIDKNNGNEIWQEFISGHNNIDLVLSGHVIGDGAGYRADAGPDGAHTIHQIFHNSYATVPGNNSGESAFARVYIFSPERGRVFVRTYDPWQDKQKTDEQNHFSFDFEF